MWLDGHSTNYGFDPYPTHKGRSFNSGMHFIDVALVSLQIS